MNQTLRKIILSVLERHDGGCMDNAAEREQLAEYLLHVLGSSVVFLAMIGLEVHPLTEKQRHALSNDRLVCRHGSEQVVQVELAYLTRNVKRVDNGVVVARSSYKVYDEDSPARWYECCCQDSETGRDISTLFQLPNEVSEDWE